MVLVSCLFFLVLDWVNYVNVSCSMKNTIVLKASYCWQPTLVTEWFFRCPLLQFHCICFVFVNVFSSLQEINVIAPLTIDLTLTIDFLLF